MKSMIAMVFLFTGLVHFQTVQASEDIEKIIGNNDLVAVNADATNIPFRYKKLVNAFGRMSMGCTATHIGQGYVLTAGHCFWANEVPMKDIDCSQGDSDILWGEREGKSPYMISHCERLIIAQKTATMDYALIKVSPIPKDFIKPELEDRAKVGDRVTIFSHPDELPLRWSKNCRIQKVHASDFPLALIHHVCDTNPGSSGATIIDVTSFKVVGIHDGGRVNEFGVGYNYGTYLFDTPIRPILKKLGF